MPDQKVAAGAWSLPLERLEAGAPRVLGEALTRLVREALSDGRSKAGSFLDEESCRLARLLFEGQDEVAARFYGGYRRSVRRRVVVVPRGALDVVAPPAVLAVLWMQEGDGGGAEGRGSEGRGSEGRGSEGRGPAAVAPALDALRAFGFAEEDVGDVLPAEEGGWHAAVARERAAALFEKAGAEFSSEEPSRALLEASDRPWMVETIDFERLDAPPHSVKDVRTTVASLRLDAVGAGGFGISRSKMTEAVKAGRVRLNWQVASAPSRTVQEGDIISVPGRGKIIVGAIGNPTRKRRLPVSLRYVRLG